MTRLGELLLFVLDRAKKYGKKDLSRFEVLKIIYLLQVYSLKYAGTALIAGMTFAREKNGPISVDVYNTMDALVTDGYLRKEVIENEGYGHPRHAFSQSKKLPDLSFGAGEVIFMDSFLSELLPLSQRSLKERAYATEPMKAITKKEKNKSIRKGDIIDFSLVSVDPDVMDAYSDAI